MLCMHLIRGECTYAESQPWNGGSTASRYLMMAFMIILLLIGNNKCGVLDTNLTHWQRSYKEELVSLYKGLSGLFLRSDENIFMLRR